MKVKKISPKYIRFRPIHKLNKIALQKEFLKNFSLDPLVVDVEYLAKSLQDTIRVSVDTVCPLKDVRCTKPFAPWMRNEEIILQQSKRNKQRREYERNKNNLKNKALYRMEVRNTDKLIDSVRSDYISNLSSNSKQFWTYIDKP